MHVSLNVANAATVQQTATKAHTQFMIQYFFHNTIFFLLLSYQSMTLESLTNALADTHSDRMIHDVKTSQLRFPPRPPETLSARETLEDVVSARVVPQVETPSVMEKGAPARTKSVQERFQEFYTQFENLEPMLATYLTPEDKVRFVRSIQGPRGLHNPDTLTIVIATSLVVLAAMVCFTNRSKRETFPIMRSSTGIHEPESLSSTSRINIERILKPLNRSH